MTIAFSLALTALLVSLWFHIRPLISNWSECNAARWFVKTKCEPEADDRLLATSGNLGVVRSSRFLMELDDEAASLILVESHFMRGGYREHDRAYLVSVDRTSKAIRKCVSVESHSPISVVCDNNQLSQQ